MGIMIEGWTHPWMSISRMDFTVRFAARPIVPYGQYHRLPSFEITVASSLLCFTVSCLSPVLVKKSGLLALPPVPWDTISSFSGNRRKWLESHGLQPVATTLQNWVGFYVSGHMVSL